MLINSSTCMLAKFSAIFCKSSAICFAAKRTSAESKSFSFKMFFFITVFIPSSTSNNFWYCLLSTSTPLSRSALIFVSVTTFTLLNLALPAAKSKSIPNTSLSTEFNLFKLFTSKCFNSMLLYP